MIDPNFVECINSLLSGGEIPGLYTPEELDGLLLPLKDQSASDGFFGTLFQYFVHRVKTNLHIALIMDPGHKDFLPRCQSNPAVYTRCSIQWWDQWSTEGCAYVPSLFLKQILPESNQYSSFSLPLY